MAPARAVWRAAGLAALGLGFFGAFVPLLPTVPFVLLAAWCFARGNPAWEKRLLDHPVYGPHIRAWRRDRAISGRGKAAALVAFAASAALGLWWMEGLWRWLPLAVAAVGSVFILSRPAPRP